MHDKWKQSNALIWADVPESLTKRLDTKNQRIGVQCLKENAEAILRFFEADICEHVVSMQLRDKRV